MKFLEKSIEEKVRILINQLVIFSNRWLDRPKNDTDVDDQKDE